MTSKAATPPLSIRLFGPFEVRVNGQPLSRLRLRKSQSVLALLALRRGCEVERDWLAGLLWPASPGTQTLRNCLTDLRRALGPEAARLYSPSPRTLTLDLAGAEVDVLAFDDALARGDPEALEEAISLYRGPLLEACAEEWLFQERQMREQALLEALEQLAALAREKRDLPAAERYLRRATAIDPFRERTQRSLVELLAASGNYAGALLTYRELRQRLHRELNAEPDPETQSLFQRLQAEAHQKAAANRLSRSQRLSPFPSTVVDADDESNGILPLASPDHQLFLETPPEKGGPVVESRPFQRAGGKEESSGAEECGEARQKASVAQPNLPIPLTRFFGREAEIERLSQWLGGLARDSKASGTPLPHLSVAPLPRLITLTGPGGSGKTRLALEVAHARRAVLDGSVCFVALADVTDPHLVPDRIREALGLPRTSEGTALEQVVAFLSHRDAGGGRARENGRPWLIVLDNLEQLLTPSSEPGAPPGRDGAAVVWTLLQRVETLRVLVTSRQCLALPGEQEFPVAPLPVPGDGRQATVDSQDQMTASDPSSVVCRLATVPSVALFLDRAQAVKTDFRLGPDNTAAVAELCRRLEGIPLAIVLAAARVRVLTPGEMLERLEQRFELLVAPQRVGEPRHRSLRAALDWSYHLLSAELQRFFIQLSVFRGGWTLEAAEQVCEAGEPRFGRGYPRSGSTDSGGGRAPGRALEFLEELEQCSLVVTEAVGAETRYRLLETLREYGAEQLAVAERTALAERHLTYYRDRLSWGIDAAGRTLKQRMDEIEREQHNVRAALDWWEQSGAPIDCIVESEEPHRGLLPVYFWQVRGSASEGRQRLARILALPGAATPSSLRARLLFVESRLARQLRDYADAYVLLQESLAIYQGLGHKAQEWLCCHDLARLAREQGDYAGARSYDEQCLAMSREAGDERGIAWALIGMGSSAYLGGDLGATNSLAEEALRIVRQRPGDVDDMEAIANACELRARVAVTRGDYASAQTDLEESLALFPELGQIRQAAAVRHQLGRVALHQGRWGAAAARFCENLLFWQQDSNSPEIAACLEGLGEVATTRGDAGRAARLLGAAAALRESRNVPIPPIERADVESAIARAQTALGEAAFAVAWAEGQAMPVDQVIAEALLEGPAG